MQDLYTLLNFVSSSDYVVESVCISENDLYLLTLILRMCTAIKFITFNLNIVLH